MARPTRVCRVKAFKQKIKHLFFENKTAIDELCAENVVAQTLAAEQRRVAESQLRRDKASLKEQTHCQQLEHEELVKTVKKVRIYTVGQKARPILLASVM